MGRWPTWLMVVSLVVAACGSGDAVDSTTSTSTSSSTTTTTVATTTTETPGACEVPIGGRAQPFDEGCVYIAVDFAVPFTFTAAGPGWIATSAGDRWVELKYDADGDGSANASITFAALEDSGPIAVLDTIEAFEEIELRSERGTSTVAGLQAVIVDVQGAPVDTASPTNDGCSQPSGTGFFVQGSGYALLNLSRPLDAADTLGVPACHLTRVWAFSAERWTIAAIGVTRDDDDFELMVPVLQEFLDNNVTFGDADG